MKAHLSRTFLIAVGAVIALGVSGASASAAVFSFEVISNNDPVDSAIVEAQMQLEVTAGDPGEVVFRFDNLGPEQSSLARFYIEDEQGFLDYFAGDTNPLGTGSAGVEFAAHPDFPGPPDLPAGNEVGFDVSTRIVNGDEVNFAAGAVQPPPQNGINPNEFLEVPILLSDGVSTAELIDALNRFDVRVGIHVIDFESGGSESAVLIPEPGTMGVLTVGLAALAGIRRRRRA